LTGGTALGRFYLNHRFSEDLDFFLNGDIRYPKYIEGIKNKITSHFAVNINQSLFAEDYTRFFITEEGIRLKVELINDVTYYAGKPAVYRYGNIDTPLNILANKLTSIVGRDEPKDLFDIIQISRNYDFKWQEIYYHAKQKVVINELDVEERLISFPVEWLQDVKWLVSLPDIGLIRTTIRQIADDFLLGTSNSLGKGHIPIEMAVPLDL
jgi:predicted nucleotidyltransferase component of viral defense system